MAYMSTKLLLEKMQKKITTKKLGKRSQSLPDSGANLVFFVDFGDHIFKTAFSKQFFFVFYS